MHPFPVLILLASAPGLSMGEARPSPDFQGSLVPFSPYREPLGASTQLVPREPQKSDCPTWDVSPSSLRLGSGGPGSQHLDGESSGLPHSLPDEMDGSG